MSFVPTFQDKFQTEYLIGPAQFRARKFSPKLLFHTIVELVAHTNKQGYTIALVAVFNSVKGLQQPLKSSLAKIRKRVSYLFFSDLLKELLNQFEPHRQTLHGLRIYAIDGLQMTLPRTQDLIDSGYNGRSVSKYRETYMPRLWLTHAYDVLSGVTKSFVSSCRLNEQHDALIMIKDFEKNSVTIYDRLYMCRALVLAHQLAGNYFLFRCRSNATKEISAFVRSRMRRSSFVFEGVLIHLIKCKNPKTKEDYIFATNLELSWINKKTLVPLYRMRWEVENSFREIAETIKLEQWHSKFENGILQEIFAAMWLINFTKIQMFNRGKKTKNPLGDRYQKPNFKLAIIWIRDRLAKILNEVRGVFGQFKFLLRISTERRKHHSRRYKREIKSPASPYPYNNTVWNVS